MLGIALAFALPSAVIGSALAAAAETLWPGVSSQGPLPEFYTWVALSGPLVFGTLGGLSGALYALMLALFGRRWSFDQLTTTRVIGLGATGGLAMGTLLFGTAGAYFRIWPVQYSIGVGIAAVLGAASACSLEPSGGSGRNASRDRVAPLLARAADWMATMSRSAWG